MNATENAPSYVPNVNGLPKVGDIWLSTYGYEACLATWYVVTKVSNKSIWLAEIASHDTGDWMGGESKPVLPVVIPGAGKVHRIKDSRYGYYAKRNSYSNIRPWCGSPVHTYNVH